MAASATAAAAFIRPALEAIVDAAGGRKHTELRHEARSLLLRLDDVLAGQGGGGGGEREVGAASADGAASVAAAEPAPAEVAQDQPPAPAPVSPRLTSEFGDDAGGGGLASPTVGSGRLEVAPPAAAAAPDDDDDGGEGGGGGGENAASAPPPPQPYTGSLAPSGATEVLRVLWLAVDARRPALMSPALDATARLAAGGFVGGTVHTPARGPPPPPPPPASGEDGAAAAAAAAAAALLGPPPPPPQAIAVGLLCSAADPARAAAAGEPLPADDALDLRILRGVLTAATAPGLHLHGGGLLQALRAAYTVFLGARTEGTRLTARAALTQIVSATFARLEATAAAVAAAEAPSAAELAAAAAALPPAPADDGGLGGGLSAAASAAHAAAASFVADVLAAVGVGGSSAGASDLAPATAAGGGVAAPAVAAALDVAFNGPRVSGGGDGGPASAPAADAGSPRSDPPSLCVSPTVAGGATTAAWPEAAPDPASAAATARRDAFLVFRALCKLGARPGGSGAGPDGAPLSASAAAAADAAAARGRVLALELLHGVVEGAGPAFAGDARLAAAARQYLCLTLLKNARSPHAPAARAAAAVFTAALVRLRSGLKAEVGVFYPMLLLAPLEPVGSVAPRGGAGASGGGAAPHQPTSPTAAPTPPVSAPPADPAARAAALRCLARVCADGPLLVDLFVNYDCDLEGAALFERTALALARVARGGCGGGAPDDFAPSGDAGGGLTLPPPPPPPPSADEAAARAAAASCLASALRSLVAWVEAGGPTGPGGAGAAAGAAAARVGAVLAAVDPAAAAWAAGRADWASLATRGLAGRGGAPPAEGGEAAAAPRPPSPAPSAASTAAESASTGAPSSAVAALAQRRAYKRDFAAAVALFNAHPKKGLKALQEGGMLASEPAAVASFLASTPGLDKTAVGEYLGERDEGAIAVMHAYVDALDFTDSTFDGALRAFLAGFRLPGEAQKIDRLVEKFAARYVECNPGAFGSADTAYVLAYSVVMLNTDAHNPQVKVKMSRADFIRNNRGINDGGDLPEAYLSAIYDAITTNEIRMKDDDGSGGGGGADAAAAPPPSSWMDTLLSLFPGGGGGPSSSSSASRKPGAPSPAEAAAIRRTHDLLRSAARGAAGFVAPPDAAAARPMVEAVWGPVLGALASGFEGADAADGTGPACLAGLVAAARLAALVRAPPGGTAAVARTVAALTRLHAPARMGLRHAQAVRALLVIGDECGDSLGAGGWDAVLRGASRWDLVANGGGGGGSDGGFGGGSDAGASDASAAAATTARRGLFGRSTTPTAGALAAAVGGPPAPTSVLDAPLTGGGPRGGVSGDGGGPPSSLPSPLPPAVLGELDSQELDRLFVGSDRLGSEAVVEFVVALLAVAREELGLAGVAPTAPTAPPTPRLFALDKVVTVAHFNMGCRIRLVWGRMWALLAAFFTDAGTHRGSSSVALHAVDALRQLAVKFLARPELAAFSFQADFLKPFVAIIRGSRDPAVRELVLACASQLAAARAPQIKSGWKAMFSVFTAAASDADPDGLRAGFQAVERVVRDHFAAIAGSEAGAFTDCVNCLVAYANAAPAPVAPGGAAAAGGGSAAPDVPLQAIAFLRFCAAALADEGGKVQAAGGEAGASTAPAATPAALPAPPLLHPDALRIRPAGVTADLDGGGGGGGGGPGASPTASPTRRRSGAPPAAQPADDDRLYLWFPLLAGLAELTFDPRPDTRAAAAEVLFDALACHGGAFSAGAWSRIFGSILLPVFDHVRAGVLGEGEYTTFASSGGGGGGGGGGGDASADGGGRAPPPPPSSAPQPAPTDPDAWLYDAATRCLGRTIDVAAAHWAAAGPAALPGLLDLAGSLARRPSAPLAAVGVAAWARLVSAVGDRLSAEEWGEAADALSGVAADTAPALEGLVAWRSGGGGGGGGGRATTDGAAASSTPSLAAGAGARRLGEARARAGTQALVVQAAADALARFHSSSGAGGAPGHGNGAAAASPPSATPMPQPAADALLAALAGIADRAAALDADRGLRTTLAGAQEADGVPAGRRLPDPPLLALEAEAGRALLSIGAAWAAAADGGGGGGSGADAAVDLIATTASRALEAVELAGAEAPGDGSGDAAAAAARAEAAARGPLAAAALRTVRTAPPPAARRLLTRLFPRVTAVLACPHAPPEVLSEVAALLSQRVAPLLAEQEEG